MLQTYSEKNKDLIVCVNGEFAHRDSAGISPFDSSVQNGDAVWEGLRLYNGRVFKLRQHLDRMRRSAEILQYEGYPDDERLISDLRETLRRNDMVDEVHVRMTVTRGVKYTSGLDPRINQTGCSHIILAEHKPLVFNTDGITLCKAQHRRPPASVLNQKVHSCNQLTSILAKLEANAAGTDDALLLDLDGNVAETSSTHIFAVIDGVITTSQTTACPEGITRQTILDLASRHGVPNAVRDISFEELPNASEIFVSGTMGELVPVIALDQHRYAERIWCDRFTHWLRTEIEASDEEPLIELRTT
ncbi:MAG: aminotransferase class IV [Planctomycetota bacterium]